MAGGDLPGDVDGSGRGAMPHEQVAREEARRWLTEPSAGLHAVLDAVDVERSWWHRHAVAVLLDAWAAGQGYARRRRPRTRTPAAIRDPGAAAAGLGRHRRPGARSWPPSRTAVGRGRHDGSHRPRKTAHFGSAVGPVGDLQRHR